MIQDIAKENEQVTPISREIEGLREYFPQCFNNEGKFDIDKFREAIEPQVDVTREGRSYDFLGKSYARMLSSLDTTTVIRPDVEHNSKQENADSENIYISGDNLDALHHLVKSYAGQVKCIYIDPPYNTGTDGFVYNDKFKFTAEELEKKLSISTDEAEKIIAMTSGHRASHAAWLTFMMPRLQLARDLLSKDGVIFISIDDNEQAYLKQLCDNIYGEDNFITNVVWKHTQQSKNDERHFSRQYNYILVYARTIDKLHDFSFGRSEENNRNYSNPDNDPKGLWRSGDVRSPNYRATLCYDIVAPNGNVIKAPENGWRWSEESVKEKIATGEIKFRDDYTGIIRKIYLCDQEGRTPENLWEGDRFGTTRQATAVIKDLFDGTQVFDTPKPKELIERALEIASEKDSIVVDFFSGSATTAHAVMEMNAIDNGSRKYILVQLQEQCKESSAAYKAGYRTIDEIGMERIKRAAKKIREENPLFAGDLGFKHYTLRDVPENVLDKIEEFNPDVSSFANNLLELFGRETVLETWMVRDGYGMNAQVEPVALADYTAYQCGDHLYLTDEGMSDEAITALVDKYGEQTDWGPHYVVLFGYSFNFGATDALKKNLPLLNEGEKQIRINIDIRY